MLHLPPGPNLPAPIGGPDATATAVVVGGARPAINVPAGGMGYNPDPDHPPQVFISPSSGGGVQATATAIVDPVTHVGHGLSHDQ